MQIQHIGYGIRGFYRVAEAQTDGLALTAFVF